VCSFPLRSRGAGDWTIQPDARLDEFGRAMLRKSVRELEEEREVVRDLLAPARA
jgi:hypothetical protein